MTVDVTTWIHRKVVYDREHEYYKVTLYQEIPIKYAQHITIQDLWFDYLIYYDDVNFNLIRKYLYDYWINGVEALNSLSEEEKISFIRFYSLSIGERKIYNDLIQLIGEECSLEDIHNSNLKELLR